MQFSKEIYNKIEAYLLGELESEALKAFESDLASDEKLRQEVDLHRELAEHLNNKEEKAFVQNIAQLTNVKNSEGNHGNRKLLWLTIIAILVVFIFVGQKLLFNDIDIQRPKTEKKKSILLPSKDSVADIKNNVEKSDIKNTKLDKARKKTKEKTQPTPTIHKIPIEKKETEKTQVFAMADFELNKSLELLINGTTRSVGSDFTALDKLKNQKYVLNVPTEIFFSGTIDTSSNLVDESLTLYIFSNKMEDYDSFKPLNTSNPTLQKIDNGYKLTVKKNVLLKPGLYYYILETTDDEELIFIDKFSIK